MPHARVGDINLEYYVEGSGPPLLLIMGFTGQASSWGEPVLEPLRKRFEIIRFSNRGTGTSDPAKDLRAGKPPVATSIREMADDAAGLLKAVGVPRANVFGVSMGGMIAQELVLNHPELVNGLVLGCTTCGPAHGSVASADVMTMLMPTPGLSREEIVRKAWPAITAESFIEGERQFLEEMLRSGFENPTPLATVGTQMAAIQAFDSYDRLPQIKAPTLIIHGDIDLLVPTANAPILHERIAGSKLLILPGAAHMFFWEQPEAAAKAVTEYLSTVPVLA
jgi:3-oxoadipate enol-lactonase